MALCVFCCSQLDVEFGPDESGTRPAAIPLDDVRDYPSFSPFGDSLNFTTSEYGRVIPIVFGSDKLIGNVFWASPITTNFVSIGGVAYSYRTVDFAIGLCEGEINGVLRQWVGDKLVYDNTATVDGNGVMQPNADGFITGFAVDLTDPTSPLRNANASVRQTRISVFNGSETQMPEGVMAAVEGYDSTPAYRGLAYVLFENFIIAQASVPALFFEVTANTQILFPRLYGDLTGTTFDTFKYFTLQYDPGFDRFYTVGDKASPSGTRGLMIFDGNSLVETAQYEFNLTYGIAPDYPTAMVMPMSGFIAVSQPIGNAGTTYVFNPFTGTLLDSLGPGGGITSHSLTDGFAGLAATGSLSFVSIGSRGLPVDVLCGVGAGNNSIGFAEISDSGQIAMISTLNNVLPYRNNWTGVISLDADAAAVTGRATFSDTVSSIGTHVYGFSMRTAPDESEHIRVWRVSVSGPTASLVAPIYTELATLSLDLFGGVSFAHTLSRVMVDQSDFCFVLMMLCPARGNFIAKYSPFTGALVWKTAITSLPTSIESTSGPDWAMLQGGKYVWIDSANKVWQVDLVTGVVTVVAASLAAQGLPTLLHAKQFYNGYENSITYLTGTAGKRIVKVFVDRLTRSTVDLSDIVVNLILRTGLLESDIDVDDLIALSLNGYTIDRVVSLHDVFSELAQAFTYDVVESNGRIKYKGRGAGVDEVIPHKFVMAEDDEAWMKGRQLNDGARVRKLNLTYRDLDREYLTNVQSVILPKYGSQVFDPESAIEVKVPIVLTAVNARILAEILLYAKLTYNTTYELTLASRYAVLDPADVVTITMPVGEDDITMRLRQVQAGEVGVRVQASQENADIYADQVALFGSIGRFEKSVMPALARRVDPFVMSIAGRSGAEIASTLSTYKLFIAWLNSHPDATLKNSVSVTIDGGNQFSIDPPTGYPTWGYVQTGLVPTHSLFSTDYASEVIVQLISTSGAVMASAVGGLEDLLADDKVNLCYIGGELMQFTTATSLGSNKWKLTGLNRCKQGSDAFANRVTVGDKFILLAGNTGVLDDVGVTVINLQLGASPRKLLQFFLNTGNPFTPPFITLYTAMNLRPWIVSDTHLVYNSGAVDITWQRRTRFDGEWPDDGTVVGEAVPLNETTESYELFLYKDPQTFNMGDSGTYLRKVGTVTNAFTYTTAMQTADGFVNTADTLYILIYQTGSLTGQDNGAAEVRLIPHA